MNFNLSSALVASLGTAFVATASVIQFGIIRDHLIFETVSVIVLGIFGLFVITRNLVIIPSPLIWPAITLMFLVPTGALVSFAQGSFVPLFTMAFFSLGTFSVIALAAYAGKAALRANVLISLGVATLLVIISLNTTGFSLYRYQGVFDNPNAMGRYAAILFLLTAVYSVVYRSDMSKRFALILAAAAGGALVLLFASNSRAALASLMAALAVTAFIPAFRTMARAMRTLTFSRRFARNAAVLTGLAALAITSILALGLHEEVINKFTVTAAAGDVSQSRFGLWSQALPHINVFGHGDYQAQLALRGVHNNYISFTLTYGAITSVFFYAYFLFAGWFFVRRIIRTGDPASFIGIAMVAQFLVYALFETGSAIFSVWLAAIALGAAASNKAEPSPSRSI